MAASNPIGLDIGSMSIRAVETARGKEGPVIANFGEVPLPEGTVQAGVIHDEKVVTAALRQLWAVAKFRGRDVVLGVTNPQTVVREMSVANLPEREMRKSLPFQVRDMLAAFSKAEEVIVSRILHVCGVGEGIVEEKVRHLLDSSNPIFC